MQYRRHSLLRNLDPDYRNALARAETLGGAWLPLPTPDVQIKQSNVIKNLKSFGTTSTLWAKTDVFYLMTGDGTLPFKLINLKNPAAYQGENHVGTGATVISNMTHVYMGSGDYVNTNIDLATHSGNYTQNSAGRGIWVNTLGGGPLDGSSIAAGAYNCMFPSNATAQRINTNIAATFDLTGINFKALYRTSSSSCNAINGLAALGSVGVNITGLTGIQHIFRRTNGGVAEYGSVGISCYWFGATLPSADHFFIHRMMEGHVASMS
jgi:hypothetical protein